MDSRYFWLSRDEVVARLKDGWLRQVWQPNSEKWADYPDLDIDEGTEISAADARAKGATLDTVEDHGEFAAE
jgi:hypothetical protein